MTLLLLFKLLAMAYSAIAVFPADVWAQTKTDSSDSIVLTDFYWKGSSLKGYFRAVQGP